MKKQIITKHDVQRELLSGLNKRKPIVIWLTLYVCISALLYILYAFKYANGIYLTPGKLMSAGSTAVMIIVPVIILLLTVFLFKYYYSSLYRIKTGKFTIIEDKLYHKEKKLITYYRHVREENLLYFTCGSIAVENEVYAYSKVGDILYIIVEKAKKVPTRVYHKSYYEIKE